MFRKLNLVGQKFNRLLVVERTDQRKRKNIVWQCLCDCGTICYKISSDLVNNRIKSCGCLFEDFSKTLRLPPGEYGLNQVFRKYIESSKIRKLIFSLSKDQFKELTSSNCYYCGAIPSNISSPNTVSKASVNAIENGKYIYNGLDRVDNNIGYIIENIVPCCEKCNRAKLTMSQKEFLELVNNIARLHPIELNHE